MRDRHEFAPFFTINRFFLHKTGRFSYLTGGAAPCYAFPGEAPERVKRMRDMTVRELMDIQQALQKKYEGIWEGDSPETAKHHLLYAVEEIGEVSAILKKRSPQAVAQDKDLRMKFCEEMADVFMYLTDTLLCCRVTAEEFQQAYREKADRNLKRDFVSEHREYLKEP